MQLIFNRLEDIGDTKARESRRYHRILSDLKRVDALLLDLFVERFETPSTELALDIDATDDPLHGNQEGRFFHGYYDILLPAALYLLRREAAARTAAFGQPDGANGAKE